MQEVNLQQLNNRSRDLMMLVIYTALGITIQIPLNFILASRILFEKPESLAFQSILLAMLFIWPSVGLAINVIMFVTYSDLA